MNLIGSMPVVDSVVTGSELWGHGSDSTQDRVLSKMTLMSKRGVYRLDFSQGRMFQKMTLMSVRCLKAHRQRVRTSSKPIHFLIL